MNMELVDAGIGSIEGEHRLLDRLAHGWMGSAERVKAAGAYQSMTGCSAARAEQFADEAHAGEVAEALQAERAAVERREMLESQNWMMEREVRHRNLLAGLPEDANPLQRAEMGFDYVGLDDGPGRDPHAAYGSVGAPAMFLTASDGTPIDLGLQRDRQHAQAQRSFGEPVQDAQIARARELAEDGYMKVQRARFHQRQAIERRQQAEAAAPRSATRAESGLGWPEYGGYPEISRAAFSATA